MNKTLEVKVAKIIADILDYYDDSYDIKKDVQYIIQIISQAKKDELIERIKDKKYSGTCKRGLPGVYVMDCRELRTIINEVMK